MLLEDQMNENVDSMVADFRKDFILYFHCSPIVVEVKKGSRKKWLVRVSKSNTGEELYCESSNELGVAYTREEAQKRCSEISNNPWKHLGAMLKNKAILIEIIEERLAAREKAVAERENAIADREKHMEEEIVNRAKELLENDKKADFGEKIMLRDTK